MIAIDNLTKDFEAVRAVDDLSFHIEAGRITGFLGPNGSGKTTTLRALLGLVKPTSGTARIRGCAYDELDDPMRQIGAMLEATAHPSRSARNHLRILAREAGVGEPRVDEVLDLVGLGDAADRRAGGFSLGMRQRLGLAGALIGDPEVLVLDEPANGLDPEGIRWLRALLRELASEGRTVLLSSHVLAEVAETVDDVVVISEGRLVTHAPLAEVVNTPTSGRVRLRSPETRRFADVLRHHEIHLDDRDDDILTVMGLSREAVGQLAFDNRIVLHELISEGPSLEEAFLTLTDTTTTEVPR